MGEKKFGEIWKEARDEREVRDKRLNVTAVLNKEIHIQGVDWEKTYDGRDILVLHTSEGDIATGSSVLIKQVKQIVEKEVKQGNTVIVTIVQKKGNGKFHYYTFE